MLKPSSLSFKDSSLKKVEYEVSHFSRFQNLIVILDHDLTGKRWGDCVHTMISKISNGGFDIEIFTNLRQGMYCLSDLGYSRIGWNGDIKKLFLSSNARGEVKLKWYAALVTRIVIEEFIHEELVRLKEGVESSEEKANHKGD